MTRKPIEPEKMKNRSVRLSAAEWDAMANLGDGWKPKSGPATMIRLAVQEFIDKHAKKVRRNT